MTLFNKDATKIAHAGCYYIHILCRLYYDILFNAFNVWLMFKAFVIFGIFGNKLNMLSKH